MIKKCCKCNEEEKQALWGIFGSSVVLVSCDWCGREGKRDKLEAKAQFKTLARYYECDMIIDVEVDRDIDEEHAESGGAYIYSTWSYSAKAVKPMSARARETLMVA